MTWLLRTPVATIIVREVGALVAQAAGKGLPATLRRWFARLAQLMLTPGVMVALVVGVVALGGALRLYGFDRLSLWLDEGFTVRFSRLPWVDVLGLRGQYDPHPPLYYALVKLVSILVPDLQAGRLLSVVTGTLTIAVLYLLVARLMRPEAGLLAALFLALSPLHFWYSQEARQYAPMTLAIALAYLALIEFDKNRRWRWAGLYGGASLAAIYIDYSALFALLPSAGLALWGIYRHRREAMPLVVSGCLAVVGFLPWLPQALDSAEREGADRAWYLGVSIDRVQSSLLSISGLDGSGLYYWGAQGPWQRWPELRLIFFMLLVAIIALGLTALARRSWSAAGLVFGLAGGTVGVAGALSLLSPAYAERTILPAVLGWCALAACAPFVIANRLGRVVSAMMVVVWLGLSLVTLGAVRDGDKQHWDALSADVSKAAEYGWPVVMAPAVTETLVELYAPELEGTEQIVMGGYGALPPGAPDLIADAEALWFVHIESPESGFARDQLGAEGFVSIPVSRHRDRLLLELFVRPEAPPGKAQEIRGDFEVTGRDVAGWSVRTDGGSVVGSDAGVLVERDDAGESALFTVVTIDEGFGYFTVDARSELVSGSVRAFLICQDASGSWIQIAPDGAGASIPNDKDWHILRVAAFCPAGTTHARLDLRNAGSGTVEFRDAHLYWMPAPQASPE